MTRLKISFKGGGFSFGKSKSSSSTGAIDPGSLKSVRPLLSGIMARANNPTDIPDDTDLYNMMSKRVLEGIRPGLANRGLLTSGVGQDIENKALSDLSTQFGATAFERGMAKQQFSTEALINALRAILGQATVGSSKGSSFQVGGSSST